MTLKQIYEFLSDWFTDEDEIIETDIGGARMTADEVMEKVLPIAKQENWIRDADGTVFGPEGPVLWRNKRTKRLIWRVMFSFKQILGEPIDERYIGSRAYIDVDDETGEIVEKRHLR